MQQTHRRTIEAGQARSHAVAGPESRRLRQELRHTVREGGLMLAFQPRRRLHDQAALGAEAHLRWPCRGRGIVQEGALIPLLEACELGEEVLAWTLHAACAAAAGWPEGLVSVSAPGATTRMGSLLALTAEALARSGLAPERLEISLHDGEVAAECEDTLLGLAALRDAGVAVALEAFGRNGACLVKLRHLPLSTIKLDRALVRDVACDHAAAAMVGTLIEYAHALDIGVAAGVENAGHCALLNRLGCDAGIERAGMGG